jgi:hypothetical protein
MGKGVISVGDNYRLEIIDSYINTARYAMYLTVYDP